LQAPVDVPSSTREEPVTDQRKALPFAALIISAVALGATAAPAQQSEAPSCAETLTQQLRRFNEKCLADLVSFVASQPKMAARIYGESEKFYIILAQEGDGVRGEAVSKFNYPLMKDETAKTLEKLGWRPPENESDNWKMQFAGDRVKSGAAAEELAKALSAYGLTQGQAMSLTVGPQLGG
jgi:hypothetical protein